MIWAIYYSAEARQDLKDIREYISDELMAPTAAANQVRKIMEAIRKLEEIGVSLGIFYCVCYTLIKHQSISV